MVLIALALALMPVDPAAQAVVPTSSCIARTPPENPRRMAKPAFKGVELHSWKDPDGSFRFSLLLGTNREKTPREIRDPACAIPDVTSLAERLASLAAGETVFWSRSSVLPPHATIEAIRARSNDLGITLSIPEPRQ